MKTEQLYDLFLKSTGVTTDSRIVKQGEIFFALWGNNYNGNKYALEALENGASWAVIDDQLYETDKTILVEDCLLELQALASHYRKELNIPVLAITGTNGKTTTKELLAAILSKKLKIHSTIGNLNNHIGVPLTILSTPSGSELMIIEMGANHLGEIRSLCRIANPGFGIITNIGRAHFEGFGSAEGVIKAKTELYEHLRKVNGVVLYNDKNPLLTELIFKIINRAVPYSDPTGTDLSLEILPSPGNLILTAKYNHITYKVNTNLFGRYNYENVLASIATGLFFNVEMKDIISAIEKYQPANNRSQLKKTQYNTLICDSYNANPTSMLLALESFASLEAQDKLVILGDMLELGELSEDEHIKVLAVLKSHKVRKAFLVGPVFQKLATKYGFIAFKDIKELIDYITAEPVKGYSILIKGSRGIGLEKVYDLL